MENNLGYPTLVEGEKSFAELQVVLSVRVQLPKSLAEVKTSSELMRVGQERVRRPE